MLTFTKNIYVLIVLKLRILAKINNRKHSRAYLIQTKGVGAILFQSSQPNMLYRVHKKIAGQNFAALCTPLCS